MQFLRTLFWVAATAITAILASRNWRDVTLNLWGDLQADIKLPVLLALVALLGFAPPFVLLRARLWQARRRAANVERALAAAAPPEPPEPLAPSAMPGSSDTISP